MTKEDIICLECTDNTDVLYADPRTPPLSTVACLCNQCCLTAHNDVIADSEHDVEIHKLNKRKIVQQMGASNNANSL